MVTEISPQYVEKLSPPLRIGSLALSSRFLLSPLAGYTNLAFRRIVREIGGVGLATTDLVNARALLVRSKKTMDLISTHPDDKPLAVQIYGADPDDMAAASRWLQEYGAGAIDINMGCPVNKITRNGGGSAMMCSQSDTIDLVRRIVESVTIPVTVKMRLGWDDDSWTAPQFARDFERAGVAGVFIHGRTREQGFKGTVNLDGIRAVVDAVDHIPVIGNGDVRNIEDAERMLNYTGCAAVSIGRGALLNPWIFKQLKSWEETGDPGVPAGYFDRLDIMSRHFHYLVEDRGEHLACLSFRKVANWYCKVLRPGREIKQRLMLIDSAETFNRIIVELYDRGEPAQWWKWGVGAIDIKVPQGANERW